MSGSEEAADRTFTVWVGQCDNTAMLTTRRLFLRQAVHPLAICLASAARHKAAPRQSNLSVDDIATFRNDLLTRVNTERLLAGASALKIDELACYVADQHALDMVTGKFLSHWGTDGRKPYHRYCRAGGFHGEIEIGKRGSFRIPVRMFKNEPGIYTVVIWISNADGRMNLAATNACIEVE